MNGDVSKIVKVLQSHRKHGLTIAELMSISGLSYSKVVKVFDELEDDDKLLVKSDGLSRIYMFKEK